ncbi:unnamed protein product [Arctogadus glacialis]
MAGATSITSLEPANDSRAQNIGALAQQCTPRPRPSLGTQRVIQGNGTNVGTVISLQCPDHTRLMGSNVVCEMSPSSPQWVGETYCSPMSAYGEFGFRVAVWASIVSSCVIVVLTMAFIICCLHARFKTKTRKRSHQKRETEEEEWLRRQCEGGRTGFPHHHHHHSRNNNNNNNNNSRQKAAAMLSGGRDGAFVDNKAPCGSCLLHPYADRTVSSSTPLPGIGYRQSPLTRDMRLEQDEAGPHPNSHYLQRNSPATNGPPCPMGRGEQESGPAQSSAARSAGGRGAGVVRQLGGQEHRIPRVAPHTSQEPQVVKPKKECSIRIISV